ncbi:malic enzyme [Sphingobium sp. JAI105]|nr:malic enzyme [Sphingobium sp. JAI105]
MFLGLSAPRVREPEWLDSLADKPLIFALANPEPEILPELVLQSRPDAIVATGWSDYPNQINNVLCFPYIFRGALDVGATTINEAMKMATVEAIVSIVKSDERSTLIAAEQTIIPSPFDKRLLVEIAPTVARAAMLSRVAKYPIEDFAVYRRSLAERVCRSDNMSDSPASNTRLLAAR